MNKKSKPSGGKLNRSETLTIRLNPKINYLLEIASKAEQRTKSSFVEWSINNSFDSVILQNAEGITLCEESDNLWDVEESDRFILLAISYPHLLNYEEDKAWKIIKTTKYFFEETEDELPENKIQYINAENEEKLFLNLSRIRKHFKTIMSLSQNYDSIPSIEEILQHDWT